jgi:translation initiation factor IF-3
MSSRRRRFRARPKTSAKKPPTNEEIRHDELRLIGVDGEQLGVLSTQEALFKSDESKTDLVIVAEKANPPVARLMDVGKHMYEKRKKHAKQKKVSKSGNIKGVRIGFKIGEHDWDIRLKQADKFLTEGNKVKLEIRLRGREKGRLPMAEQKVKDFIKDVPNGAKIEGRVGKSPRGLSALLTR